MNAPRTAVLVFVVAVLAGAVWWLAGDRAAGDVPVAAQQAPDRAPPSVPAPSAAGTGARADETAAAPARAEVTAPVERLAAGAGDEAGVIGRVVDDEGAPLPGARVVLRRSVSWREPPGDREPEEWRARLAALQETRATETDAEGCFRLTPLPGGDGVRVQVLARGFQAVERSAPRPAGQDVDLGELRLPRGGVLAGRVTDAAGRGVPDARVRRVPAESRLWMDELTIAGGEDFERLRGDAQTALTDAAGRFELAHVPPGAFALRVRHAEHPTASVEGRTLAAGEVLDDLLVVLEAGGAITGRVLGVPEEAKGLRVLARAARPSGGPDLFGLRAGDLLDDAGWAVGERAADVGADGTFALHGLHAGGAYRVWAVHGGSGFLQMNACTEPREVQAGTRGVELRYLEGVSVAFRVVDAQSGAPLTELRVAPRLAGGGGFAALLSGASAGSARFESYPDGRVTVANLRPEERERLTLEVEALGYAPFERKDIALPQRGELDLGTLRLQRAPVVTVWATDEATGAPIAGARVRLAIAEDADAGASGSSIQLRTSVRIGDEPDAASGGMPMVFGRDGGRRGVTGADGACVLNSFPGERVTVTVESEAHAPYRSAPLALPEDDAEHRVALVAGGAVDVLVLDTAGEPIAQQAVEHRAPDGGRGRAGQTDARGVARFSRLAPGTHAFKIGERAQRAFAIRAAVTAGGSGAAAEHGWEEVEIRNGETASLTLQRPVTGTLTGIVRENGLPLAGARVAFVAGTGEDEGPEGEQIAALSEQIAALAPGAAGSSGRTDDEGRYRIEDVAVGAHRLRITHRERAMPDVVAVTVRPGETTVDVALETAVLAGRVLDPSGTPIEGARVSVSALSGDARAGMRAISGFLEAAGGALGAAAPGGEKSDHEGRFALRGVRTDTPLVVHASAEGFAPASSDTVRLRAGETHGDVTLTLTRAGTIELRVLGETPPFAAVRATWAGEEPGVEPVLGMLRRDRAKLTGLRPGSWKVELMTGEEPPPSRMAEVREGEKTEIQIQR